MGTGSETNDIDVVMATGSSAGVKVGDVMAAGSSAGVKVVMAVIS